jgi:hypothetical protein
MAGPGRARLGVAALLAVFALLAHRGIVRESPTYDEFLHLAYGYKALALHDFRRGGVFIGMMPWNELEAAPSLALERAGGPKVYPKPDIRFPSRHAILLGRCTTLAAALAAGVVLAWLAHRRHGAGAALATTFLFAFDPNLLAHARYVTTDIAATMTTVAVVLAAVLWDERRSMLRALILGALIGLANVAKYTGMHVLVGIAFAILARYAWSHLRGRPGPVAPVAVTAVGVLLTAVAAVVVIDAAYQFQKVPGTFPDPPSSARVEHLVKIVGRPPTPLSGCFFDGIDQAFLMIDVGVGFGPHYLLGHVDAAQNPSPLYYPIVLALKMPIPLIVLVVLGVAALGGRGPCAHARSGFSWADVVPSAVALELLLYFSFVCRVQIGIRYLLPALALLLVPAGASLAALLRGSRRARVVAIVLACWQMASVLSFAPYFLSYVNELVPDRKLTYRIFADSNLDWGQGDGEAREWVQAEAVKGHPVHFMPERPVAGTVVVSANYLVGVLGDPSRYAWLRPFTPVAHVGYSYLVFEVRPEDLGRR